MSTIACELLKHPLEWGLLYLEMNLAFHFKKTSNEVIERWQNIKTQDILIYKVKTWRK
jgi:hypothetical protein